MSRNMDKELKEVAALALRNAFWRDFSSLVNGYLAASEGLGVEQESMLGDLTSIYGRDNQIQTSVSNCLIWGMGENGIIVYNSMIEALNDENIGSIYLRDREVAERRNGDWYVTGA